jgi:hypothetical protein
LGVKRDAFWVVAPDAGKRASFEKDGSPDAWTIVDGKFFDIKDDSGGHGGDILGFRLLGFRGLGLMPAALDRTGAKWRWPKAINKIF